MTTRSWSEWPSTKQRAAIQILFFSARGDSRADQARIVNHHRPHSQDTVTLDTRHGTQDCDGLSAHWDHERDFARIRLPSSCFRSGDYGAVRVQVLTEMSMDVDFAPEGPPAEDSETGTPRWSRWVARG